VYYHTSVNKRETKGLGRLGRVLRGHRGVVATKRFKKTGPMLGRGRLRNPKMRQEGLQVRVGNKKVGGRLLESRNEGKTSTEFGRSTLRTKTTAWEVDQKKNTNRQTGIQTLGGVTHRGENNAKKHKRGVVRKKSKTAEKK